MQKNNLKRKFNGNLCFWNVDVIFALNSLKCMKNRNTSFKKVTQKYLLAYYYAIGMTYTLHWQLNANLFL